MSLCPAEKAGRYIITAGSVIQKSKCRAVAYDDKNTVIVNDGAAFRFRMNSDTRIFLRGINKNELLEVNYA